jgi:hypothetical protein
MQRVFRSTRKPALLNRVGLVDENSAWLERLHNGREELSLQIKKDQNQVELSARENFSSRRRTQISTQSVDARVALLRTLHCLRQRNIGDISHSYPPSCARQPQGMAANSAGDIQRRSGLRMERTDELRVGAQQEGIGFEQSV